MRKTILASDMDGSPIEEGKGAVLNIKFNDGRKGNFMADLTDEQADKVKEEVKGRAVARRGRRPGAATGTTPTPRRGRKTTAAASGATA